MNNPYSPVDSSGPDTLDLDKLRMVIRKHWVYILLVFVSSNLVAYLTIRYTKDVFQSESEIKLDSKTEAAELGIKTVVTDDNLDVISGEIEQIRSRVFLNRVVDSLGMDISYYSEGKFLVDEMYRRSPFLVRILNDPLPRNQPIYFQFTNDGYALRYAIDAAPMPGKFGVPMQFDGGTLLITETGLRQEPDRNVYFFTINSREVQVTRLAQNLTVSPLNYDAKTILITYKDNNPVKARDIVSAIDSLYIDWSYEQMNLANRQKIEWLNNELKQVESRMEGYENYFESYTLQNRSVDAGADLKKSILLINKIDSQRLELGRKLNDLNHLIETLATGQYDNTLVQRIGLPESLQRKFEEAQRMSLERSKIGLVYHENTFAYRKSVGEFTALRDQLRKDLLDLQSTWLQASAELGQRKVKLEREFSQMPDKSTVYSKNQRFYKLYEDFYLSMVEARAGFEIAKAGSTPNFKILSPASMPTKPISPKRLLITGIGFVAGLVINFFLIGILYLANNRITSVKEIEHALALPVLGLIPVTNKNRSGTLYVADNPKSRVSEAIRLLRTNLDFFASPNASKVIAISSTVAGEGKSFLSLNLGVVLAMSRKRVLLVDLDMRKHKEAFPVTELDTARGMSTVLIRKHNWRECVSNTPLEFMDFVHSGPIPPNPSELLLHDEFGQVLEEMRKQYDFVILDNPPVGLVTDGIVSMKKADLSIFVFRANYSHKEFMNQLKRTIQMNKIEHLAVVLNAYGATSGRYGYGYYEEEKKSKKVWNKPKA